VRAKEFIAEGNSVRGGNRAEPNHEFERAHPGLVGPNNHGDLYIGRYYDFYRVCSLAGMDIEQLEKTPDVNFFGNLPLYSAYTEADRKKLKAIMKKLKMNPIDYISNGSGEPDNINNKSPIKSFRGYKR
jgi:hypothetical protein